MVLFFGNDMGFWETHQRLAELMSKCGFDVVGFDVSAWLDKMPKNNDVRSRRLSADITEIVHAARLELRDRGLPLVLMGHSSGAELALWVAAHSRLDSLRGVIAMAPGARGHFLADPLQAIRGVKYEPEEPGSFSVAAAAAAVPEHTAVAIVRGSRDGYAYADKGILAAGGKRVRLYKVPLAKHNMRGLLSQALLLRIVRQSTDAVDNVRARLLPAESDKVRTSLSEQMNS
jgi:pimeloyl-ACP methyl ester carboxylesterase